MKDIESKDVCDKIKSIHKEIKKRVDFSEKDGLLLKYIRVFQGIFIDISVFIFVVFLFFVVISVSASIVESEKLGQIGDSFGLITSLFTVLAFIGILLTLKEQREQFEIQNFESTFFNLLNLHNDILQNMDIDIENYKYNAFRKEDEEIKFKYSAPFPEIKIPHKTVEEVRYKNETTKNIKSRDCFYIFYKTFDKSCKELLTNKIYSILDKLDLSYLNEQQKKEKATYELNQIKDADKIEWIKKAYLELHETHNNNIGHYFRNLYQIFTYIGESNIKDKVKYGKIVRAQFSKYEIFILYYNCFVYENFKIFAEKYALLKGITEYPEWKNNHIVKVDYYKESAFG